MANFLLLSFENVEPQKVKKSSFFWFRRLSLADFFLRFQAWSHPKIVQGKSDFGPKADVFPEIVDAM